MMNTTRTYINALNANDVFTFPGSSTLMVVESRRSEGGKTTVTYRESGTNFRSTFTRAGLTVVDLH